MNVVAVVRFALVIRRRNSTLCYGALRMAFSGSIIVLFASGAEQAWKGWDDAETTGPEVSCGAYRFARGLHI